MLNAIAGKSSVIDAFKVVSTLFSSKTPCALNLNIFITPTYTLHYL